MGPIGPLSVQCAAGYHILCRAYRAGQCVCRCHALASARMWEIETYRDGPVVRTTVRRDGKEVELPWWLDTVTKWGARRKAMRHIRRLESEDNPDVLLVYRSRS